MMGHGKHCYCIICNTGKALGILEVCEITNCPDPRHKGKSKSMAMKMTKTKAKLKKKTVKKKSKR